MQGLRTLMFCYVFNSNEASMYFLTLVPLSVVLRRSVMMQLEI